MEVNEKVRENRARRKLERMGYRLIKSRRRDPDAFDFGGYGIVDAQTQLVVFGYEQLSRPSASLDGVEGWISEEVTRD